MLGRARSPLLPQSRQVDRLFPVACLDRGHLRGVEPRAAVPFEVVDDRRAPLRERPQRLLRHAVDVGHPLLRLAPLDSERPCQLEAQLRLVEVAGREPVGLQQRLAVECAPLTVRTASHVRDDHVRVQVRILRPRRPMLIRGRDEPRPRLAQNPVLAPTRDARLPLEIGERRLPGRKMRLVDRVPDIRPSERVEKAHALGRREDKVVARDRRQRLHRHVPLAGQGIDPLDADLPLRRMRTEHSGADRMTTTDQPPKLTLPNHTLQPEPDRTGAGPDARRLALARVVGVDPRGDRPLVVGLLARRKLRHRQHGDTLASGMHMCLVSFWLVSFWLDSWSFRNWGERADRQRAISPQCRSRLTGIGVGAMALEEPGLLRFDI